MIQIEVKGLQAIQRKLGSATAVQTMRPAMARSVARLLRDMAEYPAPPSGSTYRRTGTLGRRWTTKITISASGMTGTVGNNTSYGPYVQSAVDQASVHSGRWQTDRDVAERNESAIIADFEQTIQGALNRG